MEDKPIKGLDIATSANGTGVLEIPRKRKSAAEPNGQGSTIGEAIPSTNGVLGSKRSAEVALGGESPQAKRSKTASNGANGASENGEQISAQVIDDSTDGAIVIDD